MDHAIRLESVSKIYDYADAPPFKAVDCVTLRIKPGQIFGFLGPNGAGKTTTIKMICGLVIPSKGSIELNGFNVITHRPQAMQQMGAILEGGRNTYWQLNTWQNVLYFGRLKGAYGSSFIQHSENLLRHLGLWERRFEPVGEFSRGMQQKVALACAMAANPPIILLDEPTLGLDMHAAAAIKHWVKELAHTYKKTVILTTHQLDIAERLCDEVAIMNKGKLIVHQPMQELLGIFHQRNVYHIKVDGMLTPEQHMNLRGYIVTPHQGSIMLTATLHDSNEIYNCMAHLQNLSLPILSVVKAHNSLEDVFMHFMNQKE